MVNPLDEVLGTAPDGTTVGVLRLANDCLRVALCPYGARMLAIEAPDRDGRFGHVLLGFDRADQILKAGSFGAALGRYANRIAGGRFSLDGTTYRLQTNDGANTLHGGAGAFSKRFWTVAARDARSVAFTLASPDGDGGFPGSMEVSATYTLDGATLRLALAATVDRPCPVNLSAHPYFNLGGADALDTHDHDLQVAASAFLPTDAQQIPTGERRPVDGTAFDFQRAARIGSRIRGTEEQLLYARGFDHCFVLDGAPGTLRRAARLSHPASGRVLELDTDCAGLQVYTGNSLNGALVGHGGTYRQTAGLALEAQAFPDAPNQPSFPSTVLRPGERFAAEIAYRFSAG